MSVRNGVLAFLGGALVGATIALLFAPEKGEVTRRKIGNAVRDGKDKLVDALEAGREKVVDAYNKGRNKLADAIHESREVEEDIDAVTCPKPGKK